MDLRDYQEMPDKGLFEKIQRRLYLRRVARWTGVVVAAVAVVMTALVVLLSGQQTGETPQTIPVAQSTVMAEEIVEESIAVIDECPSTVVTQEVESVPGIASPKVMGILQEPETSSEAVSLVETEENTVLKDETPVTVSLEIEDQAVAEKTEIVSMNEPVSNSKAGQPTPVQPHVDNVLWAPNAILPNAEDAQNRQFKVIATSSVSHFHMVIYNRGGRQVFESSDIDRAWDATVGGRQVPQGTYVWMAKFLDSDGVLRQEKGTVTVIR